MHDKWIEGSKGVLSLRDRVSRIAWFAFCYPQLSSRCLPKYIVQNLSLAYILSGTHR